MRLNENRDIDGSACLLELDEAHGWLRATWTGFIDPAEAQRGAASYLHSLGDHRCAYLLNDNTGLRGPWFDAVHWLQQVWLPQARQLGLRYVAHVVQADTHADILTLTFPRGLAAEVELQLFENVREAEEWLGSCRQLDARSGPLSPSS